jgi:hypothetical protein
VTKFNFAVVPQSLRLTSNRLQWEVITDAWASKDMEFVVTPHQPAKKNGRTMYRLSGTKVMAARNCASLENVRNAILDILKSSEAPEELPISASLIMDIISHVTRIIAIVEKDKKEKVSIVRFSAQEMAEKFSPSGDALGRNVLARIDAGERAPWMPLENKKKFIVYDVILAALVQNRELHVDAKKALLNT